MARRWASGRSTPSTSITPTTTVFWLLASGISTATISTTEPNFNYRERLQRIRQDRDTAVAQCARSASISAAPIFTTDPKSVRQLLSGVARNGGGGLEQPNTKDSRLIHFSIV